MSPTTDLPEYLREQRRKAYRAPDERNFSKSWTEEEWVKTDRHVDPLTGTIVYHSFSDYCD